MYTKTTKFEVSIKNVIAFFDRYCNYFALFAEIRLLLSQIYSKFIIAKKADFMQLYTTYNFLIVICNNAHLHAIHLCAVFLLVIGSLPSLMLPSYMPVNTKQMM